MSPQPLSRREALAVGSGVSLAAISGCVGPLSDDTDSAEFEAVPADAQFVATVDVERVLDDEAFRDRIADSMTASNPFPVEQPSVEELLDGVEAELDLDPREVRELVAFGNERFVALVADADWSEDDVAAAVEDNSGAATSTTHAGQPVYEAPDLAFGVLPDDRYVVSLPDVVREVVDVVVGDSDPLSGDLTAGYEDAPDGYLQFAFELPAAAVDEQVGVDTAPVEDITYGYGGLYRNGDDRGGELVLETTSSAVAGDVADLLETGVEAARAEVDANDRLAETFDGDATAVLDATAVTQDGSTVTVENDDGRGLLASVPPAMLATFILDLGASAERTPAASFAAEYDDQEGELVLTHEGGDAIPASELFVRGVGVAASGSWASLHDSTGNDEPVAAGDSLRIDAQSDFHVDLVWDPLDSPNSAMLGRYEGPDA